jgi:hypothetical protein
MDGRSDHRCGGRPGRRRDHGPARRPHPGTRGGTRPGRLASSCFAGRSDAAHPGASGPGRCAHPSDRRPNSWPHRLRSGSFGFRRGRHIARADRFGGAGREQTRPGQAVTRSPSADRSQQSAPPCQRRSPRAAAAPIGGERRCARPDINSDVAPVHRRILRQHRQFGVRRDGRHLSPRLGPRHPLHNDGPRHAGRPDPSSSPSPSRGPRRRSRSGLCRGRHLGP